MHIHLVMRIFYGMADNTINNQPTIDKLDYWQQKVFFFSWLQYLLGLKKIIL